MGTTSKAFNIIKIESAVEWRCAFCKHTFKKKETAYAMQYTNPLYPNKGYVVSFLCSDLCCNMYILGKEGLN